MNQPTAPEPMPNVPQQDPFPRMIIVCVAITMVGLFVIFGLLVFDFIGRQRQSGQQNPGQAVIGLPPQFPQTPTTPK